MRSGTPPHEEGISLPKQTSNLATQPEAAPDLNSRQHLLAIWIDVAPLWGKTYRPKPLDDHFSGLLNFTPSFSYFSKRAGSTLFSAQTDSRMRVPSRSMIVE